MRTVVTFGTFDLFHIGHLRILERAASLGDRLVVGISTDEFNWTKKRKKTAINYTERSRIVQALQCVDAVFPEESMAKKRQYLIEQGATILVMGDDWEGKFDEFKDICQVVYLKRTPNISSTLIKETLSSTPALG